MTIETVSPAGPRPAGARDRDQPRRQGRQGRPALLVHRARRRRRREGRRRDRLRQGPRGPAGDPEGRRERPQEEPDPRAQVRPDDHPPDHRPSSAPATSSCARPSPGTGVIAGGGVRAVLELGRHPRRPHARASAPRTRSTWSRRRWTGLEALRTPEEVAELRGLTINAGARRSTRRSREQAAETIAARGRRPSADAAERGAAEPPTAGGDGVDGDSRSRRSSRATAPSQNQRDTLRSLGLRPDRPDGRASRTRRSSRGMLRTRRPPGRRSRTTSREDA